MIELQEKWYQPLLASKIISPTDLAAIFTTTEKITNLHKGILAQLIARFDNWSETQKLADIFIENAPALTLYTEYVNSYDRSLITLKKCLNNEKFVQFGLTITPNPIIVVLPNILIQPIQRIPRYTLLLEDLLKKSWVGHPDYPGLQAATDQMRAVAKFINDQKRKYENKQKLAELQLALGKNYQIESNPLHPKHDREIIREGSLEVVEKEKLRPRKYVLMSDSILIWKECKAGLWSGGSKVELFSDARDLVLQPKDVSSVEVLQSQNSFILTFSSPAARDKWIEDVASIRSKWTETLITTPIGPVEDKAEDSPNKKKDKKKKDKLKDVKAKDSGFKSKIKKGTKEVLDVAKEVKRDLKHEKKPKPISESSNLLNESKDKAGGGCGCCG